MTTATKMDSSEAIKVVEDDLESMMDVPTERQRKALAALPSDDIAADDVCDELGLEHGSTWGEVRDTILKNAKLELRWFEATVTVTKLVRLPAESEEDANEKLYEWAYQDWSRRDDPFLLEEMDITDVDADATLMDD